MAALVASRPRGRRIRLRPRKDFGYLARYPRGLSPAHEARLINAARRNARTREENLLVLESSYLQLILLMGRHYEAEGLTLEQAMEIGQEAVRQAVFGWDRKTEFSGYAMGRIQGAFERFLSQMGREHHAGRGTF